jgi:hypothetical protein
MKIKSFFSNLQNIFFALVRFYLRRLNFLSEKINLYTRRQAFLPGNPSKFKLNLALNGKRYYSTVSPKPKGVKYDNADTDKLRILSENKGKIGVYMWINLETGKRYIGSSVDLKRRFLEYFNVNRLLRDSSMTINRALLKYGYSKFSLDILEYCSLDELAEREKHYFNLLKPEYNILKVPGSPVRDSG